MAAWSWHFGEVVIGAPGAGKLTYAYGKHQLFTAMERPIAIVNLDPRMTTFHILRRVDRVSHYSPGRYERVTTVMSPVQEREL